MAMGEFEGTAAVDRDPARDELIREGQEATLHEAAERATFHRIEAERWERIGRSAGAALKAINDPAPVAQVTPESLIGDGGVRSEPAQQPQPGRVIG